MLWKEDNEITLLICIHIANIGYTITGVRNSLSQSDCMSRVLAFYCSHSQSRCRPFALWLSLNTSIYIIPINNEILIAIGIIRS